MALQFLPLFVVQTTVASNVAITAIGAALLLGTHLPRAGWVALGGVLVGLAVIAASAQARQSVDLPTVWRWVLLGTSIPVVALGIWAHRRGRGGMVALAAGLAFSVVAIAARALEFPDPLWRILLDPLLWTLAVQGIAGTLLFARAAQTSNVTRISTVTFTTETVLPSVVGVLFLQDAVRPGWAPFALAGFALAVGGAVVLSLKASQPVSQSAPPRPDRQMPIGIVVSAAARGSSRLLRIIRARRFCVLRRRLPVQLPTQPAVHPRLVRERRRDHRQVRPGDP